MEPVAAGNSIKSQQKPKIANFQLLLHPHFYVRRWYGKSTAFSAGDGGAPGPVSRTTRAPLSGRPTDASGQQIIETDERIPDTVHVSGA